MVSGQRHRVQIPLFFFTGYVAWAQHLKASWWAPRKSFAVFGTFLADLFYFAHTFYPILGLFWTWASKRHYSWCPLNIFSWAHHHISPPQPQPRQELHWPLGTQHLLDFTATGSTNTLTLREDDQCLVLEIVSVVPWPGKRGMARGIWSTTRCGRNAGIMDEAKKSSIPTIPNLGYKPWPFQMIQMLGYR